MPRSGTFLSAVWQLSVLLRPHSDSVEGATVLIQYMLLPGKE